MRTACLIALVTVFALSLGAISNTVPAATSVREGPDVHIVRDVAYGPDPKQRFDVYVPPNAKRAPVLFMVHGGAWAIGDKSMSRVVDNKVAHWLPRGFVFISINNRLLPAADPLEQANDVAKALAHAQKNADSWGADTSRFVLMGHSAGAHLVMLLAADPQIAFQHGARQWLGTISLDTATLNVVETMEARHPRLYDRAFGKDAAFWRSVSPSHRLTHRPQPVLLVCSSRRRDNPCEQAGQLATKVKALGGEATVLPEALSHGDINGKLGLASEYTQEVDAFLSVLRLP